MLNVDSRNVHTFIIGEHGDSELPVWSSANISGIDLDDFCRINAHSNYKSRLDDMFEEVRNSAYRIIESKGATYYAIAQAVLRIVGSIIRDEDSILPVSTLVEGHYGRHDICLGVPLLLGSKALKMCSISRFQSRNIKRCTPQPMRCGRQLPIWIWKRRSTEKFLPIAYNFVIHKLIAPAQINLARKSQKEILQAQYR